MCCKKAEREGGRGRVRAQGSAGAGPSEVFYGNLDFQLHLRCKGESFKEFK